MKIKKLLAMVAASALAVSAMAVSASAVDAQGEDGFAGIAFAGGDWTAQNWFDGKEYASEVTGAVITGNGTYTVSVKAISAGTDEETGEEYTEEGTADIAFAALQVVNGETLFPGMVITIDSVKLDGNEVALNGTPYTSSDDKVTTRVNLFNEWVSELPDDARTIDGLAADATPTALDKACGEWTEMTVTFTVSGIEAAEGTEATEESGEEAGAGDTTETDGNKGNSDTGVEGVAVVAGLAVVAAGAVIVAKKRG